MIALPVSYGIYGNAPDYSGVITGFSNYQDWVHSEHSLLCLNVVDSVILPGTRNPTTCAISQVNAYGRAIGDLTSIAGKRAFGVKFTRQASTIAAIEFGLGRNITSGGPGFPGGALTTYSDNWTFRASGGVTANLAAVSVFPTDNYTGASFSNVELLFLIDTVVGSWQIYGPNGWVNRDHPTHPNYVMASGLCGGDFSAASIVGSVYGSTGAGTATKLEYLGGTDGLGSPNIPHTAQIPSGYVSLDGTVFF